MPYRRLPKTNNARVLALRTAVEKDEKLPYNQKVMSLKLFSEARIFANNFEQKLSLYQNKLSTRIDASKRYQQTLNQARMYISHFIQVFNLAVIRGEIKKENRTLYGLSPNSSNVPNLNAEDSVLFWGGKIIEGEEQRTQNGGIPIYNPAINKVRVHYDIFKEHYDSQQLYKSTTGRSREDFIALLAEADRIILEIWNKVEEHFKNEPPETHYALCREFGIVYYFRNNEQKY
ncbi:MAG: hypothetical protein FWF72_07475 [Paludibacter sp.]|nr:hypothetical protein [Paludibacter sp.]